MSQESETLEFIKKSLAKALQDIKQNIQKEAEGHAKLGKSVSPPFPDPNNMAPGDTFGQMGLVKAPAKKIPQLKKPCLGKDESCLNKDEKASKERQQGKDPAAVSLGRKGGLKGGPARVAATSHAQREAIAEKGAAARWGTAQKGSGGAVKKEELDPNEKAVERTQTVVEKPADGAKLPPKKIPQIPVGGTGGEVSKGKELDKGAIADAVNAARKKAGVPTNTDLRGIGFPGNPGKIPSMKKAGIPAAPTAPKPKMPATNHASANPTPKTPPSTPKAL